MTSTLNSVGTGQLLNRAVTTNKLASGAVTPDKLSSDVQLSLLESFVGVPIDNFIPPNVNPAAAATDMAIYVNLAVAYCITHGIKSIRFRNNQKYNFLTSGHLLKGVEVFGGSHGLAYYPGAPGETVQGTVLVKGNGPGSDNNPIFYTSEGQACQGFFFDWLKEGGAPLGILCVGENDYNQHVYNSKIRENGFFGLPAGVISPEAAGACIGIFFPHGNVDGRGQRYRNIIAENVIQSCDIGIRLGGQSNANIISNNNFIQCNVDIYLDGYINVDPGNGCLENVISGNTFTSIGIVPGIVGAVFILVNGSVLNFFGPFSTENTEKEVVIDASSVNNMFLGVSNEYYPSYIPTSNVDFSYMRPVNRDQRLKMLLPNNTTSSRYLQGQGLWTRDIGNLMTGLPQLNGSGAMVAGSPNCVRFITFTDPSFSKAGRVTIRGKLVIEMTAYGGGVGTHFAELEYIYRCTDGATNAGTFRVTSVLLDPPTNNFIAGVAFIKGTTAGVPFAWAMCGGNFGAFTAVGFQWEHVYSVYTYGANTINMGTIAEFSSSAAALTLADQADAINALAIGSTVV